MGAIKDIHDLTASLINSVKDRRLASELMKIQSLTSTVQSEHFDARERNIQLLADNVRLQQQVSDLEKEMENLMKDHTDAIAKLKQEQTAAIARLASEPPKVELAEGLGCGDIPNIM